MQKPNRKLLSLSKISGTVLNDVKTRFDNCDAFVIDTLNQIAEKAEKGKEAILNGDSKTLNDLINENFDLRLKIMNISESNLEMIKAARKCGASAKFSGSGGSIIGLYTDDEMLTRLIIELKKLNARVIKPYII